MKLMDIDSDTLGIPDTDYDARVTLPSNEFTRIVRDLSQLGESVRIEVSKEGVRFASEGEAANGSVLLKQSEGSVSSVGGSNLKKGKNKIKAEGEEEDEEEGSMAKKINVKKEKGGDGDVEMDGDENEADEDEFKPVSDDGGEDEQDKDEDDDEDEEESGRKRKKKVRSRATPRFYFLTCACSPIVFLVETCQKAQNV